jgi:uncharacterized Ntn-hydrolase superfamily protein
MTFSICVRERYENEDGNQYRFGVAVTTRLPAVGTLCPFANEYGAVATQSLVNVELGRRGVQYLKDGLAVDDALQVLLHADEEATQRQLHGVGRDGRFVFSGEDCSPWFGDTDGDGYTIAGNLLTGESVIEATADTYLADRHEHPAGPMVESDAEPLASRLIDALAAGHAEGGDKREELHVQSAAVVVETTAEHDPEPAYNDLRVDATETPIESLRETYELAFEGHELTLEKYGDAYEEDDMTAIDNTD